MKDFKTDLRRELKNWLEKAKILDEQFDIIAEKADFSSYNVRVKSSRLENGDIIDAIEIYFRISIYQPLKMTIKKIKSNLSNIEKILQEDQEENDFLEHVEKLLRSEDHLLAKIKKLEDAATIVLFNLKLESANIETNDLCGEIERLDEIVCMLKELYISYKDNIEKVEKSLQQQ